MPLRPAEDTCLLIADISGYTGYLTSTEIEHAQDVISDFIETVIKALEPTFELIETEGDAVFVVAPAGEIDGQLVLDIVDATYFTFRRHSRSVVQATTCECNACRQIGSLDLKFVVHTGAVIKATMGRRTSVTGPAVIVAHRLLKNSVVDTLGPRAYLLLTESAVRDLQLDAHALTGVQLTESYEHIGEVPTLVIDLEERWMAAEASGELRITPAAASVTCTMDVDSPPAAVWDAFLNPWKRLAYSGLTGVEEEWQSGRRDRGTIVHCAHGDLVILQELVEWRPFERYTQDMELPGLGKNRSTYEFEALPGGGTRVTVLYDGPRGQAQEQAWPTVSEFLRDETERVAARLTQFLADEKAGFDKRTSDSG
jgi:class 3 adenylate cyclase